MRSLLLCTLVFYANVARAWTGNQCPVLPPKEELLNENFVLAITSWLNAGGGGKISNVRDFICCMPEFMRENVTIAFASESAQRSHYHSSRVIIFDKDKLMSFSLGNDPKLPQSESIEIMQNNRKRANGTLELYDVDISKGRAKLSERDPEKCMTCHGGNPENRKFGPHPIFGSDKVWGRFFGGISPFCSPGMAKAINAANAAVKSTLDNKRLDCLNKKHLNVIDQPLPLQLMDNFLKIHNANRIARIIRATPDYEKYKYLILGSALCVSGRTIKTKYKMKISEWMPDAVIKKHDNLTLVDPIVRAAASTNDAIDILLAREFRENEEIDKYLADAAQKIAKGENPVFREYDGAVRCQKKDKFPAELKEIVKSEQQGNPVYDKYVIDSHMRGTGAFNDFLTYEESHQKVRPMMRFIFEGRGIDIGDWDMSARRGSYGRDPADMGAIFTALLNFERDDSPVKKFQKYARYFPPPDEVCEELKALSFESLSKASSGTLGPQKDSSAIK